VSANQLATTRALAGNATDWPMPITIRKPMIAVMSRNAPVNAQAIDHRAKPQA
jgi:hypothetical protein